MLGALSIVQQALDREQLQPRIFLSVRAPAQLASIALARNETKDMVKSLELVETVALVPGVKVN